ncbi:hypothetical protein ACA910_020043 [Epithemia clementina (nom. ined.)]
MIFAGLLLLAVNCNAFLAAPHQSTAPWVLTSSAVREEKVAKETVGDKSAPKPLYQDEEVAPLPPVIPSIADERLEYQMNIGKAMDTLRRDYQDILTQRPDFSIYDKHIRLLDPSGVQLTGLEKYKSAFAFFQTFLGFWFSTSRSGFQFRMVYDFARCSIRISWHAVLVPKLPVHLRPLHVDGISYYQLDRKTGKIIEHKIENLTINNSHVAPPYRILNLLQLDEMRMKGVPVGALTGSFQ